MKKGLTLLWTLIGRVEDSMSYAKLTLLDNGINRGITKKHVETLKESMMKYGFVGRIIVVETKAFGKKQLVIVDGQNRYTAAMQLGLPISYEIMKLENDTPMQVT